eukprot:TRINITY_DN19832_c0_g1_i1.p1 TRINITY_DN19832_c0_g1~~TRINITY_DN19832_c0_g1_i1.p1  ORF type:complete len:310 (+),score=18.89 TRINITY_DN19832_c0_g1_i1:204-1133(+)
MEVHGSNGSIASRKSTADNDSKEAESVNVESAFDKMLQTFGLVGCVSAFDVGAMECSFKPVRFGEARKETRVCSKAIGWNAVSHIACDRSVSDPLVCCVPENDNQFAEMFAACAVCAMRPATIVEVPCGHVNVCGECHRDYRTNTRCLRCREHVSTRLDVAPFLETVSGRPDQCKLCRKALACVVIMPCIHMGFCKDCLPNEIIGCPTCGDVVEQMCVVQWALAAWPSQAAARNWRCTHNRVPFASPLKPSNYDGADTHNCLQDATDDVDAEIRRLEQQLQRLRAVPIAKRTTREGDDLDGNCSKPFEA